MPTPRLPGLARALDTLQSTLIALCCLFFIIAPLLLAGISASVFWLLWQTAEAFRLQEERDRARRLQADGQPGVPAPAWLLEYPLTPPPTREDREREWEISSLRERAMLAQPTPPAAVEMLPEESEMEVVRESTGRRVSFLLDEEVEEVRRGRALDRRGVQHRREDHDSAAASEIGTSEGSGKEESHVTPCD